MESLNDLQADFAALHNRVRELERNTATKLELDQEVSLLVARIERTERNCNEFQQHIHPEYDPQVTLIVQGLRENREENILLDAKKLVHQVLNEPDIPVINALRIPSRNNKPGIVKMEIDCVQNKVKLLRKKGLLREIEGYKNGFLRSSKTHVARLLELNIRKLLDEIPNGHNKYRITANGRLVEKDGRLQFGDRRGPMDQLPRGQRPMGQPPREPPRMGPAPMGPAPMEQPVVGQPQMAQHPRGHGHGREQPRQPPPIDRRRGQHNY